MKTKKKIDISKKKIVMIVAPENFRDEELFEPKMIFEEYGARPVIASKIAKVARGTMGSTIKVDIDYSNIDPCDFDLIIFIGGGGSQIYFEDEIAHKITKEAIDNKKIIAAICSAPLILAKAGVLKKKKFTSFKRERPKIKKLGGVFVPRKKVVVAGNIITANGPDAAQEFGKTIVKKLAK